MQFLVIGLLVALLTSVAAFSWRNGGPTFTFVLPNSITVTEGEPVAEQAIRFPNLFLGELNATFSVEPMLQVGDIIEIDMHSPTVLNWAKSERSFRIQVALTDRVTHTYFFYTDEPITGNEKVRLRITSNDSIITSNDSIRSDAFRQNGQDNWFWMRQFYNAKVIS